MAILRPEQERTPDTDNGRAIKMREEFVLYQSVKSRQARLLASNHPFISDTPVSVVHGTIRGHSVSAIGESHGTMDTARKAHKDFAGRIMAEPERWLILLEGLNREGKDESFSPNGFYLSTLASIAGVPILEALSDPRAPAARKSIMEQGGLEELEFYRMFLTMLIGEQAMVKIKAAREADDRQMAREEFRFAVFVFREIFGEDRELFIRIIDAGPISGFEERIGRAWNGLSRIRFQGLLDEYSGRKNVLAVVGVNHLPVFEQD